MSTPASRFRVPGSGFRFLVFGSRVPGSEFRVSVFGFRISIFGFWVSGSGFRVSGFGFRVSGSGSRVSVFGFWVSVLRFRVPGFGFRGEGWRIDDLSFSCRDAARYSVRGPIGAGLGFVFLADFVPFCRIGRQLAG